MQTLGRQRGMAVSGGIGKRAIGADSRPLSCGKRKEEDAMDKEKGTIYLAYGSNLNLKQMACRCPTAQVLGSAKLTGYRLFFRGGNGGAVATIERQKGGIVPVLLWRITPYDEEALDRYEGYPRLYWKETVKVRFKGQWVSAMVYIMNEGRPLGAPSRYYYEVIRHGYIDAGFDISVLNKAVRDSVSAAEKSEV